MKMHLRWFFALLIMLTGSFAFASGVGYANPGGFDVPEVHEDFGQFDHAPGSQQEQPINDTEVKQRKKEPGTSSPNQSRKDGNGPRKRLQLSGIGQKKKHLLFGKRLKVSFPGLPMLSWMPFRLFGTGSWSTRELW
ncbi:hypothetical protein [Thermoactinomyces mirandus]|uniref:Secreted protein n=1 Tax=Thermoactinomyces mirandus TaxID=2756294 RepID=A0A7W1XRI6_9BACL|nr:hypothetical protein [Thermoactinomyces mirandus]MBA4601977.1 hypothetical protein [Thermoactinomyces mirandus]